MTGDLAHRLANDAVALRFDDLAPAVVHEAKRRVIDSFGCALGAWPAEPCRIARRVAGQFAGNATLWGTPQRVPTDWAAFANGCLVRYLDFNDTYLSQEPAHPSDNIPAAFAVAETVGATGRDLITAIVLAYELQCRLCDTASLRARGWDHVSYVTFSSALAAAKLMRLDVERTRHALNIAGVSGAALRQSRVGELSHWKAGTVAHAARRGVFAALLAREGMTGPAPIFEGDCGFEKLVSGPLGNVRLFGESPSVFGESPPVFGESPAVFGEGPSVFGEGPSVFGEGLPTSPSDGTVRSPGPRAGDLRSNDVRGLETGAQLPETGAQLPETGAQRPETGVQREAQRHNTFMMMKTHIKFWPAEYHSQSAIEAALRLRSQANGEAIESVLVQSHGAAVDIIGSGPAKWHPTSRETADHSLPFIVAAALTDGEITARQFTPERIAAIVAQAPGLPATGPEAGGAPALQSIQVERDAALTALYPAAVANIVAVRLRGGRTLTAQVDYPKGHARHPLTDAEVEDKFLTLAEPVVTRDQAEGLLHWAWRLDEAPDLSNVFSLLEVAR